MFAAEGAKVVVAEFDEAPRRARRCGRSTTAGGDATFVRTDVSDETDRPAAMVDHAMDGYGRVDVLYNNAGVMPEADHSVIDTDVAIWDQVMAVNVRGVFLGCKYAIPRMVERRVGIGHQHRLVRRAPRLLGAAGCLHRVEGRGPVA